MGDESILEDAKVFLRSTLLSKKHGIKQSSIEKDYEELVGETLPWRKLGFKTLFDFLLSIPEVAKLEWREEDEDNRVFAVLDKESYASLHAKRMSVKGFGRGSKPLSPEEMKQWQETHGSSPSESEAAKKAVKDKNQNKKSSEGNKNSNCYQQNGTRVPSSNVNEKFSSHMHVKPVHFKNEKGAFKPNKRPIANNSFPKNLPSTNKDLSFCVRLSNMSEKKNFHEVDAAKFVTDLSVFSGFVPVEAKGLSKTVVLVRYKTKHDTAKAKDLFNGRSFDGVKMDVLQSTEAQCSAGADTYANPSNFSLPIEATNPSLPSTLAKANDGLLPKPGLLPTPDFPPFPHNVGLMGVYSQQAAFTALENINEQSKRMACNSGNYQRPFEESVEGMGRDARVPSKKESYCGLHNETEFVEMFLAVCRCKPKVASGYPDRIKFIVTFSVNSCRFWIHLLDQEAAVTQLMDQLQAEINHLESQKVPILFPSAHQFGAARYSQDGLWYRCWVLDSNKERNQIHVFYCDYGNDETVSVNDFRLIHARLWSLIPQAIPVKLHGVDIPIGFDKEKRQAGLDKLNSFCIGKLLESNVVTEGSTGQSEIVEIRNVIVSGYKDEIYLEDIMVSLGHLEKIRTSKHASLSNSATKKASIISNKARVENGTADLKFVKNRSDIPRRDDFNGKKENVNGSISVSKEAGLVQGKSKFDSTGLRHGVAGGMPSCEEAPSIDEIEGLRTCSSLFEIDADKVMKIEVLAVESPSLFYFKTRSSTNLQRIVMDLMEVLPMKENADPVVGCKVCLSQGNVRLRVKVLDLACNFAYSKKVLVIDVDTGRKIWANSSDIFKLTEELMQIPDVASKAALAGISTKNQVSKISSILSEMTNKEIFAHVIGRDSQGLFRFELYKDCKSKSVNANAVHKQLASIVYGGEFGVHNQRKGHGKSMNNKNGFLNQNKIKCSSKFANKNRTEDELCSKIASLSGNPTARSHRSSFSSESAFSDDNCSTDSLNYTKIPMQLASDTLGKEKLEYVNYDERIKLSQHHAKLRTRPIDSEPWNTGFNSISSFANSDVPPSQKSPAVKKTTFDSIKNAHVSSVPPQSKTGHCRPHAQRLPHDGKSGNTDEPLFKKDLCDSVEVSSLMSSIVALEKDHVVGSLINLQKDNSLNRDLIEVEKRRWRMEKERLKNYVETLKEALTSSGEASRMTISRSRKKKLELHVSILGAEKQLEEISKELNASEVT